MKTKILITLCFAVSLCVEVYGEGEQEVKRGLFPFMAYLYYPDDTVVDGSGARFLRGAVLIRVDWLVTSAIDIVADEPTGFPRKTLIARVGAITIDSNFTLNEDEDEQEREIIKIVRPYNHSATQWWHTDISLMKTLEPFKQSLTAAATSLINKLENTEKTCSILVYAKKEGNSTDDRYLMKLNVELIQAHSSLENCGQHFVERTMICATDSDENKHALYDPNFCQGNSGGPLICDNDVVGLQTYIDNDCKQPHLYQLLSTWDNFITCGTEEKCNEEECSKICDITNKDPMTDLKLTTIDDMNMEKTTMTGDVIDTTTLDSSSVDSESYSPTLTESSQDQTAELSSVEATTLDQTSEVPQTSEAPQSSEVPQTTTERQSTDEITTQYVTSEKEENTQQKWPHEKSTEGRRSLDQNDIEVERKPSVEAQHHHNDHETKVKAVKSIGPVNILSHSFMFGYTILAYIIIV